ncbi:MAG: sugar phosphate isomerase/epimerase [Methylococcales bacterium]|nr:sugar phosphate isomerase/epimerase [Methylococcales bacterium]
MRLSVSNIAWDVVEDEAIAGLLNRFGIDAIDIAPGKYFPDPIKATDEDIARIKNWWADRGIEITGMQALLFGTTGLNMFGLPESQSAMLQRLTAVCRISAGLGARRLVFGSVKNRDRTGLSNQEAIKIAVPFFQRLGDIAQSYRVLICLEPVSPCYGANFMITNAETAEIVQKVAHPSIRMQLDTGVLTINGEDSAAILQKYAHFIEHVHASEPQLLPLGEGGTDHAKVAEALKRHLPDHVVCVEMMATTDERHEVSIARSLTVVGRHYCNTGVQANA